jgi:L-aspartate oxidase
MAPSPIVVVGAGIAGLFAALKLAPRPVILLTAGRLGEGGSSPWAQGGLAAAIGTDDSPEEHLADTVAAGAGLVDLPAAAALCREGPAAIDDLLAYGVPFDRNADGGLSLGREAAHGRNRIVHVGGDEAGATIMAVLAEQVRGAAHIEIRERQIAYAIRLTENGARGLAVWDIPAERAYSLPARHIVLATGGVGGLYAVTTNPLHARGLGLSMALGAGAALRDLEFVQFHPTAIDIGRDPAPLATEALRGAGATLHDAHGRRFMTPLHEEAELAPRDIVARGVAEAIATTGQAFLDTRAALGPSIREAFPTVYESCMAAHIDPVTAPIPIAPAAHYHMGGIATDKWGRTSVDGLFAIGECASTGVHGANRLASNSLLEALVFADRAASVLRDEPASHIAAWDEPAPDLPMRPPATASRWRRAMSDHCGLLRSGTDLAQLATALGDAPAETMGERLALTASHAIVTAALAREESRGAHQRTDFPQARAPRHSRLTAKGDGFAVQFDPVRTEETTP